ncbi:hypothetical protein H4R35_004349, partial [Dimargaris xerosporica]
GKWDESPVDCQDPPKSQAEMIGGWEIPVIDWTKQYLAITIAANGSGGRLSNPAVPFPNMDAQR